MLFLLAAIAEAHAGPAGSTDPQLIASIVAAVVTTLSGGGGLWWLRRNRVAGELRDDQSARARAAIARDNADQVLREVTANYRDELATVKTDCATNRAAIANIRDEIKRLDRNIDALRAELQQAIRDERAGAQGAEMVRATLALSDKLTAVMRDIERRGGHVR